jgi:hypothetical protein
MDRDGTIWTINYEGGSVFRSSTDGGKTFQKGPSFSVDAYFNSVAVSPNLIFAAGKELSFMPRDGSAAAKTVPGLPEAINFPHVLVTDERDNVVVLTSSYNGSYPSLDARRLAAGAASFTTPKTVSTSEHPPSAVALSENAIAVLVSRSGQVLVAVETWP